jgi:hypothetical protein
LYENYSSDSRFHIPLPPPVSVIITTVKVVKKESRKTSQMFHVEHFREKNRSWGR